METNDVEREANVSGAVVAHRLTSKGLGWGAPRTKEADRALTSTVSSPFSLLPTTDDSDGTLAANDDPAIRRKYRIRCTGSDVPELWRDFYDFPNLTDQVVENLASMTVLSPTPIQMQAASVIHSRRDLLACAPTGSGKTLAYLLPLLCDYLSTADERGGAVVGGGDDDAEEEQQQKSLAIIVEPTRELARQVYSEAGKIGQGTGWRVGLLGEEDTTAGSRSERTGESGPSSPPHVLVTTPLKLVYAIKQGSVDLSAVQSLILDEADKLFELGFLEQTDEIIAACKHPRLRKAMFSATIPSGVEELAKSVMGSDVVRVIIGQRWVLVSFSEDLGPRSRSLHKYAFCGASWGLAGRSAAITTALTLICSPSRRVVSDLFPSNSATASITQELTFAGNEDGKLLALKNLIRSGGFTPPALIFVQSVDRAKDLNKELLAYNVKSDLMHAERTREERDRVVERFAQGKVWVLVCTDVMSRGVDFRGVELVIK